MGTTLVQTYRLSQLDLGFKNLIEVVKFDDFSVFKDENETQVLIQDVQL